MHAKAANNGPFGFFTEKVVIKIGLLRSRFQAALVVGLHAALLAFGEFIFTQSNWLWSPCTGKTSMIHAILDEYSDVRRVENNMSADENNLIWIDLEMTGLDPGAIASSKSPPR